MREETSLYGFVNVLLKYRGMVTIFVLVFGVYGTLKFVGTKPKFTSRVVVNVEPSRDRASETALAQFGDVTGRHGTLSQEIAFYTELLRSPALLRQVANDPYTAATANGTVAGPLGRFYGFKGRPESYRDEMTSVLTENVRIAGSPQTGNLWIYVDAPYPELSQQIAINLVKQVDDYSRKRRHAQAGAEREFVQERLAEARAELRAAEGAIVEFQLNNRDVSSPGLVMTNSRLQRDVTMKQQLYTSLLQSYDRARIEESRTLPVITILESPEKPVKAERSSSGSMPVLGAIAGLLIAIVLAFIRERMAETSAAPTPAFDYYTELKRQALRDLRNPLRPFGRALKPRADA